MNFQDLWGLSASDKNGKPPSPQGRTTQPQITPPDPIQEAVNNNLGANGGTYGPGNKCDDWTKKVLDDAKVNTDSIFAGDTETTSVDQHIDAAEKAGNTQDFPDEGWNEVFMDKSPEPNNFDPHAGLVKKNSDNSIDFYDQSSGNDNKQPDHEKYGSQQEFEDAYGYDDFHYIPIK